jgi:hypothetical protein
MTDQEMQYTCKRNVEARSFDHYWRGNSISITYSGCVSVALIIQRAKRIRSIVMSSPAWPVLQYFSTLSHKQHDIIYNYTYYRDILLCTPF